MNCKYCKADCIFRGEKQITECKGYIPMTNADRIRAMSDEELCEFLSQYKFCDMCVEGCDSCTYNGDCGKRLLEWFKEPVG